MNSVDYFWGMQCYLIRQQGAEAIIREVEETPMDGHIDSYLSRMIKQGKLKVYVYNKKVVNENSNQTDIQINMKYSEEIDPFDYKGYIMR
jgi:GR25 family glycosyltransferase involved in LPS biosynthesis